MTTKLPNIPGLDYTMGVIDGLKWCLNCGMVASAEEIAEQIKKLQSIEEDTIIKMEEDSNKNKLSVNDTYDIIISQILETFPNACNIVRCGVYEDSAVVEFSPYDGATTYSATLFAGCDKVVIAVII